MRNGECGARNAISRKEFSRRCATRASCLYPYPALKGRAKVIPPLRGDERMESYNQRPADCATKVRLRWSRDNREVRLLEEASGVRPPSQPLLSLLLWFQLPPFRKGLSQPGVFRTSRVEDELEAFPTSIVTIAMVSTAAIS